MAKAPKIERPIHERVRSALRKVDQRSQAWRETKSRAMHPTRSKWFVCETCHEDTPFIKVDHIVPVGSLEKDLSNLHEWAQRLFVSADKRQAICDVCHNPKTRKDNAATRAAKGKKKGS